jgi:hypothetical protein
MLKTKYVLMFVVLSAGMLTGLTATGMSLGQTALAEKENYKSGDYEKNQKIDQENKCKIEISNEHGDDNRQNDNQNDLTCQNLAQNAKGDASVDGNPFTESSPPS